MNRRTALRRLVREVLEVHPPFGDFRILRSWVHKPDASMLPLIKVATPRERVEGSTGDEVNREAELFVHALIKADDPDALEDDLDALADEIEGVVMAALRDRDQPLFGLVSVETEPQGDGAERVGSALLQFREVRFEPEIC